MRRRIYVALFLMLSLPYTAQSSALQKMFESLGGEANISSPGGFQDQAHGYYTGGGIVMRRKTRSSLPLIFLFPI